MNVSTQSVHPLTVMVAGGQQRDPVGHLVEDRAGDREFRFVKMRGGQTASQGMPAFAYISGGGVAEDNLYDVTVDGASVPAIPDRDLAGIVVGQSTAASADFCYIMTKGRLGKLNGSMYPDTVFALVSAVITRNLMLHVSAAGSVHKWQNMPSAFDGGSIGQSQHTRVSLVALSTDVGDKLTRGRFASPYYHGGLSPAPA